MDDILYFLRRESSESRDSRQTYEYVWAEALKLMQGVFLDPDESTSTIRNTPRSFYRLAWSARQQISSIIYGAYLRDQRTAEVIPLEEDPVVLALADYAGGMVESAAARMRSADNLYAEHLSAIYNCLDYGFSFSRFVVKANGTISYNVFPPERLYLDWAAESLSSMRFAIIEHYVEKQNLQTFRRDYGLHSTAIREETIPDSHLRLTRTNMGGFEEYVPQLDRTAQSVHIIWESYVKIGDDVIRCFTSNNAQEMLSDISVIGPEYPIVLGYTNLVPHRLVGEPLASSLAAPQATYNELINSRLDNLALVLKPRFLYRKDAGISLRALSQYGAGNLIDADDLDGIRPLAIPDVTGTATMEAQQADALIRSIAGLPEGMPGTSGANANAVSQVYNSSGQKIDLIVATFADTYWRRWHQQLLTVLALITPNEVVAGIVPNSSPELLKSAMISKCGISVSHSSMTGKEDGNKYLDILMAALQVNDRMMAVAQSGMAQGGVPIVNLPAVLASALETFGCGSAQKFFTMLNPPPPQQPQQQQQQGMEQKDQKLKTKMVVKTKGINADGVPTEVTATQETQGGEIRAGAPEPPAMMPQQEGPPPGMPEIPPEMMPQLFPEGGGG